MPPCSGNGECLQQCGGHGHKGHSTLIGGTTATDVYCKSECAHNCQLVECNNYILCGQKRPKWVLNTSKGICLDCRSKQQSVINECPGPSSIMCCCFCYDDEEHNIPSEICRCGHREHWNSIGETHKN